MDKSQENTLVSLLKELEPGFLPYEIFKQIARLTVLPIVEFVPLRINSNGKTEVLLLKRSKHDDIFPGQEHTPGTVIRPTDKNETPYQPFERILKDELADVKVGPPRFVGSLLNESKRGKEQAQVYWIEVLDEPKVGKFYELDQLPQSFMESQRRFVEQAVRSFEKDKAS